MYTPDLTHGQDWFLRPPVVARTVDELTRLVGKASDCESLRVLDLRRTQELRQIDKLHHLRELELTSCVVTPDFIERIGRHAQLRRLYLASSPTIDDEVLEAVASFLPLTEYLAFYCCESITDHGVVHLASLKSLSGLRLDFVESLTDAGTAVFAELPALCELCLRGCHRLSDVTLEALGRCLGLEILTLPELAPFSETALIRLFESRSRLRRVSLSQVEHMTDKVMAALAGCRSLEYVYLFGCGSITDRGIRSLESLGSLRTLVLRACRNVTSEGVSFLRKAVTRADIVYSEA